MIQGRFGRLRETMSLIRVCDTGLNFEKQAGGGRVGGGGGCWSHRQVVEEQMLNLFLKGGRRRGVKKWASEFMDHYKT